MPYAFGMFVYVINIHTFSPCVYISMLPVLLACRWLDFKAHLMKAERGTTPTETATETATATTSEV